MTQQQPGAAVVLVHQRGMGGEDTLLVRPTDGLAAVVHDLPAGTVARGGAGVVGAEIIGVIGHMLRANGTLLGGIVYQYNGHTGVPVLTPVLGVGVDDVLAATVNEPAGAILYDKSGAIGLVALRGEGIVGVLTANGTTAAVHPYKTGTIPNLLGNGSGGRAVEDIAAFYYYKLPNSPRKPMIMGAGEGLSGAMPIPKEDSGMPDEKTNTDVVVTVDDDDVTGGLAVITGRSKFNGNVLRGLGVAGIAAASLAVTGLAGGAATTAAGLGVFTALLCGVTLVNLRVLAA